MPPLTIGKLAAAAGVHVETVRYYERRGLIERPRARRGAVRVYPEEAVRRIRSIKRAQSLGFSLKEIKELLVLRLNDRARCGDVLVQAERKLGEVEEKLRALRAVKAQLRKLSSACRAERPPRSVPFWKPWKR
ncbi:MAG: MerR family transcriptional regulator [Nitrospinota bacterium]|jgi:MerR family mercuric resistance operon transcriptional regulator|nr:MerR family transcriptional regulator [Nitrospinota bacterium]